MLQKRTWGRQGQKSWRGWRKGEWNEPASALGGKGHAEGGRRESERYDRGELECFEPTGVRFVSRQPDPAGSVEMNKQALEQALSWEARWREAGMKSHPIVRPNKPPVCHYNLELPEVFLPLLLGTGLFKELPWRGSCHHKCSHEVTPGLQSGNPEAWFWKQNFWQHNI